MKFVAQVTVICVIFGAAAISLKAAPVISLGLILFGLYTIASFVRDQ